MLVDIHNHILPGLDDGPQSMEEAILLARNAVANGVTHIIATPHYDEIYKNDQQKVKESLFNFNREISHEGIPLKILLGQEIRFFNNMVDEIDNGLLTLANSGMYILIELPWNHFPTYIFDVLVQLQLKGYKPIIAHPERNIILRKDKQLLLELVNKGTLFQITAASLLGINGFSLKKYTHALIKRDLVHFIASDAHHYQSRPFLLKEAYQLVRKKYSIELESYFIDNAKHVVLGKEFQSFPPISIKNS
ncbi:CpsB/CapC family capsule biosynthesis tyrosine phosphatase [Bacillus sp. Cr_A10]|uniref:tyrosine-protein phosphatase n=1 Tax=Bacillus sp. Cr_A10 TaxID=3033993 RepID=UPI0023DAFE65|nr:CpsB/CapC family capsule biosynthesis tyrosine phosphatase [Bacillus sp. Cr_A10]MDF2065067.1 hypothetical protein [Bacillus sp. Cr_A10]